MRTKFIAIALLSLVVSMAATPVRADKKQPKAPADNGATEKLYGISWYKSVDEAVKAAQKSSPGKPIFVWRMLGDLDGKT
jgi:hypothetical protein